MSHQTKAQSTWVGGAAAKRVSASRVRADDVVGEVVRFRTFPSETSRRLMATMAMAMDMPRASMKMEGGAVGHIDIPHHDDSPDDVSDGDWSDAELEGEVEDVEEVDDGEANAKEGGKKKRKPRTIFYPSKKQMARTISKCLPKQDVEQFELLFKALQGVTQCPSGCDNRGTDVNAFIIKTRVVSIFWALQQLYGVGNVVCEMCNHINSDHRDGKVVFKRDYLEIVMMDAVLSRSLNAPRRVTGNETVDTPVKFRAERAEYLDAEYDLRFRAFIAVVPDGATYYCHRDRRNRSIGKANEVIPMDTSWLRIVKNGNRDRPFADGGYVSRLWDCQPFWKFKISRGEANFQLNPIPEKPVLNLSWNGTLPTLQVMSAYQCPDELGPCLPPDFINGEQHDGVKKKAHLRRAYRMALMSSKSARRGCRHYAHGYLHRIIDPNETLIINPEDGDIDIRVAIQIRRPPSKADAHDPTKPRLALSRESVVLVRYLPHLGSGAEKLLLNIRDHASTVQGQNKHSARNGLGDHGSMFPLGSRIMKDNVTRKQYVTSTKSKREQCLLKGAVVASSRLAAVTIPGILRILQDTEEDGDIPPPPGGMNGDSVFCRISHTMDVSVDLSNSSHYDVNDASQGFTIWTEDEPGSTRNWYFILPNVYGKRPDGMGAEKGAMFHGVAIRLTHGVLISWDGRVIRHGTSVMERTKHVYGSFFAAKSSVVAYGARMAFRREAIRRRRSKCRRRRRQRHDVPGGLLTSPKTGGCRDTEDVVDLLSIPIARKSKAVGDSVSVEADVSGNNEVDEPVDDNIIIGDDILGDDNLSWSNHSFADDVNDSTSCDSGMILDLTPGHGNELMGGLVIDAPDDDDIIQSDRVACYPHNNRNMEWNDFSTNAVACYPRNDGFCHGHERHPPNDRYNYLKRGQEYPSPNDGKMGWNDFCSDAVARYAHNDGFHRGHDRRPRPNDRYNILKRGQEYPSPHDGKGGCNDFRDNVVGSHPRNKDSFHRGHERRPSNDGYNNLKRGQEYPSPNDGKMGWNDFCTDAVARYAHNDGFHRGHDRRPRPNDRYNILKRGQEYPSPHDGKGGCNDFRDNVVGSHPRNKDSFHRGHERRPSNDGYNNLKRGQEYPSPNDGKMGWNDFCTDAVARYAHNDGFHRGHDRRPRPNDRYNILKRGQEYPSPHDGKGGCNDFRDNVVGSHPRNKDSFHRGHERRPPNDGYNNLKRGQEYPSQNDGKMGWNDFCTDAVARYDHNDGFHRGHDRRPRPNDRYNILKRGQEYPSPHDGKGGCNDFRDNVVGSHPRNKDSFHRGHEQEGPPNDSYFRGQQEHCFPHHSPKDRKRVWHGDWQGSHGDCDVPSRGDGIISRDHRQRMDADNSRQYHVLQPAKFACQVTGRVESSEGA